MTKELFEEVSAWQKKTFTEATAASKVRHLFEEAIELHTAILEDHPEKKLEFADCFLLLFGAAASDGMSYDDILNCIKEKLEINKARKWGKPNELGVVNHIKESHHDQTN